MIELLDPTREVGAGHMAYAPRPSSLKGKTVGLIENTKYNSDRLLEMIGQILVDDYGVAFVLRKQAMRDYLGGCQNAR